MISGNGYQGKEEMTVGTDGQKIRVVQIHQGSELYYGPHDERNGVIRPTLYHRVSREDSEIREFHLLHDCQGGVFNCTANGCNQSFRLGR